jgi:hypothetical protein
VKEVATMKWWRRREGYASDRWLAAKMLDEALHVFGTLQAAAYIDDPRLDAQLRERFRLTALDILDDVACLASLTVTAPPWPSWPRRSERAARDDERPSWTAVQALGEYTQRLVAVAAALADRENETATAFARLAATAEVRIEVLASS